MSQNITYYLGAGASFHSMPLQETLGNRLRIYRDTVYHLIKKHKSPVSNLYLARIDELLEHMAQSTSIDNYAKDLYISNSKDAAMKLSALKKILSHYLIFEQLDKGSVVLNTSITGIAQGIYKPYENAIQANVKMQFDKRYRTFFNEIFTQESRSLPKNINIISWNYDLQIEGTYCRTFECTLDSAQQNLKIYPPKKKPNETPQIVKLNGTAGLLIDSYSARYSNIVSGFNSEDFEQVIWRYIIKDFENNGGTYNSLCFSFEQEERSRKAIEYARKIINETDILIIIGYSFPRMNRQVDRDILAGSSKIKRVIIQVKDAEYETVESAVRNSANIISGGIRLEKNLNEFFVPDELN